MIDRLLRESTMVNKIKRTSLQSEIIRYILDYISEHDLNPGDKLPSQENLLAMMGVSRTSLREAMKTLEARGILEIHNGKGAYVGGLVDVDGVQVVDFKQEKERLLEALEVRKILEREILRMLIHTVTDEELKELGEIKILMSKFRRGLQQTAEDKKFHYTIYRLCHNQVMY